MTSSPTLPNFFIIGAAKAGTTALYDALRNHPHVYMSPVKEPHYFCKDMFIEARGSQQGGNTVLEGRALNQYLDNTNKQEIHGAMINRWEDYLRLFEDAAATETAIGEASPSYLGSEVAAIEIKAKIPDVRIVAILRDPVARAYSHYLMNLRTNLVPVGSPLLKAVEETPYLKASGFYSEPLKRYFDAFGRENVKVFLTEDLRDDPDRLWTDLCHFLAISAQAAPFNNQVNAAMVPRFDFFNLALNRYPNVNDKLKKIFALHFPAPLRAAVRKIMFSRKFPKLSEQEAATILDIYREDIEQLSDLISRDLSSWLTPLEDHALNS